MIDWVSAAKALVSLAKDVSDDRIYAVVPYAQQSAQVRLGSALTEKMEKNENPLYISAVAHFIVSRLVLSLRELSATTALSDTKGYGVAWGEGSSRPAATSDLVEFSRHWQRLAEDIIALIIKEFSPETEDAPGWYDI